MASRAAWFVITSCFLVRQASAYGLNRSGLQTIYCHECVLPFTLKVCCQFDCERTVIHATEQLLVRLDEELAKRQACESVVFFNEKNQAIQIGAIRIPGATTVGLVVPDSSPSSVREWRPFQRAARDESQQGAPKEFHWPRVSWFLVALTLTCVFAQIVQSCLSCENSGRKKSPPNTPSFKPQFCPLNAHWRLESPQGGHQPGKQQFEYHLKSGSKGWISKSFQNKNAPSADHLAQTIRHPKALVLIAAVMSK